MDSLKSFQLLIVSLYLTAVCSPWGVSRGADGGFLETIIQSDGGVIVKVAFRNFNSIQTSAGGFNLLQTSNGTDVVTFWSKDGELIECQYERDPQVIYDFLKDFTDEPCLEKSANQSCIREKQNASVTYQAIDDLPPELLIITETGLLIEKCSQFQEKMRRILMSSNPNPKRQKRAIGLLRTFPGTNWCGPGNQSKNAVDLGVNAAADKCCRAHDHCKRTIPPFSWKYHLFNYRFHTVSHCKCDENVEKGGNDDEEEKREE